MVRSRARRRGAALPYSPFSVGFALLGAVLASAVPASAQRIVDDAYLLGEEQRLEIVVSVIGAVQHPGEYRVPDDTDVLELIAKAGGPNEFANLAGVSLRRREGAGLQGGTEMIIPVNISAFLSREDAPVPPVLAPGDVVSVPRNRTAKWKTAFAMLRDVSVVVTTYILYLRYEQDK